MMFGKIINFFRSCRRAKPLLTRNYQDQLDQINIPDNLLDPIDFDLFRDPVITQYGHVYSRHTITTHLRNAQVDPFTNQPLTLQMLSQPPQEITNLINGVNLLKNNTLDSITRNPKNVNTLLTTYQAQLNQLNEAMGASLQRQIVQGQIRTVKNNLKIDVNNPAHTAFWQTKGKSGRNIPTHVNGMMRAANGEYHSVGDFISEINRRRQMSFCSRFFKYFFRDDSTKSLYNLSNNLRTFVVR